MNTSFTFEDVETLARTIYGEARGQPQEGMEAVATVVLNRWRDRRWGKRGGQDRSIAEVCLQRLQFSCHNSNDPNLPKLRSVTLADRQFQKCYAIAARAVAGEVPDTVSGANHYLTRSLFRSSKKPSWATQENVVAEVGDHVFLKL